MSKLTRYSDFGRIKEFDKFANACSSAFSDLVDVVNGNIDFDGNINCCFVDFHMDANVDWVVTHTLGRVPIGKIVIFQTSEDVVFDTDTEPTIDTITVRCATPGHIKMILF